MARLNARPSHAPTSRDESEAPQLGDSDQENRDPGARSKGKGKAPAMGPPPGRSSLLTPTSDPSDTSRGQKRKRVEIQPTQLTEEEQEEAKLVRYYDPNQNLDERREHKRKSRLIERDYLERREVLLNHDNGEGLVDTVKTMNSHFKHVKQTGDATLDSRMLVNVSDLGYKKATQMVNGDMSTGVDVDEFLAKCITYMRNGGPSNSQTAPTSSRRQKPRNRDEDDLEDDDAGLPLDWELLGRNACFPYNSRPPVPTFLLGPLSVEKKQRSQTQRRAKQSKDTAGRESRPEALSKEDLQQSDDNGLTAVCMRVNKQLRRHITKGHKLLDRAGFTEEDVGTERHLAMLKKCRMTSDGGVSLFEYAVNPHSFGQTVENLFYISFLIKEGALGVQEDRNGLPTLMPREATSLEKQRELRTKKHQAVFAIDYATWAQLIEAFDIREPMIPHREDEQPTQMGARGWYN
ncbi:hypothetical protein LTR08_006639 [Meristemomyces frigidus]|nr:hypothetical protein LTR08_006639 [Meristemomyces frigidus]